MAMTDKPDGKRWGRVWPVTILMIVALYPLSVGPMVWLENHDWIPSFVMNAYRPLWNVPIDRHPWDWLSRWETFWRNR
jgi:hypothetical protein